MFSFFFLVSCENSNLESGSSGEEKEHNGIDFLPPVKEYKDRAGSAAGAVEEKANEVHKQFEMLDR